MNLHWFHWVLIGCVAIYLVDLACAHFLAWRERRDAHIKAALLNRYSMGAFKAVTKDWRS
jgi:hypothetical protein